ncbi:MAG: hypothetical protein AAFY43_02985, partial [Pseudomonadota bacterium]
DILSTGSGRDTLVFASPNEGGDRVLDFDVTQDTIQLVADGFAGLSSTPSLVINGAGQSGQAALIFNTSSQALSYDADGAGGSSAVLLATLEGASGFSAGNISIVSSASTAMSGELERIDLGALQPEAAQFVPLDTQPEEATYTPLLNTGANQGGFNALSSVFDTKVEELRFSDDLPTSPPADDALM